MANTAAPRQKTTMFAPVSSRERKIRSGTSGWRAKRPSISTNSASSARPTASVISVRAEPQPCDSVSTIP